MGINVNKYNKRADYLTDQNRPTDECCASQVDSNVAYNGVNVMLKADQLCADNVCVVLKDNLDGTLYFVPIETYQPTKIDVTRYTVQNFILFGMANGKKLYMSKNNAGDSVWAERNFYKIECDLTANGGFTWAVTINDSAKGNTVAWEAGATLDSIVAQMTPQAVNYYLDITHEAGEDFIRVAKGGYSNSTFTISGDTGVTLTDLSRFVKINGVAAAESHRDWQSQSVATLFPSSGFLAANSVQYARNGYNLSYYCGGNLARYKTYYRANGSATWVAENAVGRMKEAAFNSCADGTIGGADGIALYNKYNGSWDAYMAAGMVHLDDTHRDGVEFKSYDNGVAQSGFLASVTTLDFDGSYIPAYPAAAMAAQVSFDGGAGCLPTEHELGVFMEDARLARINAALAAVGGSAISITGYYWGVAGYYGDTAWFYHGYFGVLRDGGKYNTFSVRPVLAV